MVGAAGLEPATLCLEGRCSIQLSYAPARRFARPHRRSSRTSLLPVTGSAGLYATLLRVGCATPFGPRVAGLRKGSFTSFRMILIPTRLQFQQTFARHFQCDLQALGR